MIDFTLCVAIDEQHAKELLLVWPTWVRHRPEILKQPVLVLHDFCLPRHLAEEIVVVLSGSLGKWPQFVPVFPCENMSQRDKMLTALTLMPPQCVKTPWILKLDTDAVALRSDPHWCSSRLVADDGQGVSAFVSNRWGYSRPAEAVKILDDWGDTVPELACRPRLDLPFTPGARSVGTPGRIISWCFFGRTDWWLQATSFVKDGRLPLASHDTFLWYCAKRRGDYYRTYQMKRFGWDHCRGKRLEERVKEAMA